MSSEVIRCSDCGAVFKAVPSWLATAKVKFTCTSCPRRSSRSGVRFEPAVEPVRAAVDLDSDNVVRTVDIDGMDDDADNDADMDMSADDLEAMDEDKDL